MGFEVFTKRLSPLAKTPSVTIQRRGLISLNRAAYALMGEPKSVELLYDRDERVVGLRPADDDALHGYPLRAQASKHDTGPLMLAGTAFTQYYDIDTTISRRWVPRMQDGMLCIDLKQEGAIATSNRSKARGAQTS